MLQRIKKTEPVQILKVQTESEYFINRCKCGWQFLSLYRPEKKCPQCKTEAKFCLKCGNVFHRGDLYCSICKTDKKVLCANCNEEKENPFEVFCLKCQSEYKSITVKNIKRKSQRFVSFLSTQTGCPHNYDCLNCPEPDCIVPADEDTIQGRLF